MVGATVTAGVILATLGASIGSYIQGQTNGKDITEIKRRMEPGVLERADERLRFLERSWQDHLDRNHKE